MHDLHNHADEKGFSGVHIMSIDLIYPRLSEGDRVGHNLRGISRASDRILG